MRVDGRRVTKPAQQVAADADLGVDDPDRYVARSARKLLAALDGFRFDPAGRLALDLGASTGGFTQVLLERGAREVIALDVGRDQLVAELRADPRVRVVEGVNARDLDPAVLARVAGTTEAPSLVVADLSFISLAPVLPAVAAVATPDADVVVLVKPQFEVGRVRDGVVRDRAQRHRAVRDVAAAASAAGLRPRGVLSSPLPGSSGNQEYLLHLGRGVAGDRTEWDQVIPELA